MQKQVKRVRYWVPCKCVSESSWIKDELKKKISDRKLRSTTFLQLTEDGQTISEGYPQIITGLPRTPMAADRNPMKIKSPP